MTNEEAIKMLEYIRYTGNGESEYKNCAQSIALDMAIKALETLEEFEKAQIITGGKLNGRTYAYKCGLEDGKRKALEQESTEWQRDHAILKAYSDGANDVLDKIRAEIEDLDIFYDNDYFSSNRDAMFKCSDVLQIIDKYRTKSEEDKA